MDTDDLGFSLVIQIYVTVIIIIACYCMQQVLCNKKYTTGVTTQVRTYSPGYVLTYQGVKETLREQGFK